MGAVRVIFGTIFCLTAGLVIVFIANYEYVAGVIPEVSFLELYQLPFFIVVHPYYGTTLNIWSGLFALIIGAFVGGLLAKGLPSGLVMGFIAWLLNLFLYLAIVFSFSFDGLITYWPTLGNALYIDLVVSFLLLELFGALGGKLTSNRGN